MLIASYALLGPISEAPAIPGKAAEAAVREPIQVAADVSDNGIFGRLQGHLGVLLFALQVFFPERLANHELLEAKGVVRNRLGDQRDDDPRTLAVHAAAARTSLWSSRLPDKLAFDLGRTASRLPSVVYWYRQGVSLHDIGRRLSGFGGAWDAERALDVAAALIADALNQGAHADLAA